MLVIFEGADGSGKSYLLKQLLDYDDKYIHVTTPKKGSPTIVEDWENIKNMAKEHIVCVDRSCLTELVYRSVLKDNPLSMSIAEILNSIDTDNTVIVFCDTYTSFEDSMIRGEDYITERKIHNELRDSYRALIDLLESKYKIIEHDRRRNPISVALLDMLLTKFNDFICY